MFKQAQQSGDTTLHLAFVVVTGVIGAFLAPAIASRVTRWIASGSPTETQEDIAQSYRQMGVTAAEFDDLQTKP
jgi:hypothetical protein